MEKFHEMERRLYKKHSGGGFDWFQYETNRRRRLFLDTQGFKQYQQERVKEIDDRADREGWFHGD